MNLSSQGNTYRKHDISTLYNLKRIFTFHYIYENEGSCFLEDVLLTSRLEYVYIYNTQPDSNIIASTRLLKNVLNFRFINIE